MALSFATHTMICYLHSAASKCPAQHVHVRTRSVSVGTGGSNSCTMKTSLVLQFVLPNADSRGRLARATSYAKRVIEFDVQSNRQKHPALLKSSIFHGASPFGTPIAGTQLNSSTEPCPSVRETSHASPPTDINCFSYW